MILLFEETNGTRFLAVNRWFGENQVGQIILRLKQRLDLPTLCKTKKNNKEKTPNILWSLTQ